MELMEDASCAWVSIFSYNLNALTQNSFLDLLKITSSEKRNTVMSASQIS